jgi:nitroreductase
MNVTEAVARRRSVRAFKPDPVPGALVRDILEKAARAPSGGNLQPWRVYGLAGEPLAVFNAKIAALLQQGVPSEPVEYEVYPPDLWEPFRSRRFQAGEDLYATIDVSRDNKLGRLAQFANNYRFFGAPAALFFCLDRRLGPPQWADLGMYMQTVMLLAVEAGLDTCAQEAWSRFPLTIGKTLDLPEHELMFSGMALGYADDTAPINTLRTRRDSVDDFAMLKGF